MDEEPKRLRGRPPMPDSTVIHTRIDNALLERLSRYLDREASFGHTDINRATFTREAIEKLLTEKGY